ncbi:MAG: TonB-dependent receptor [Candidatus Pelagadaptatus aseana]|uniref:TonB-dependent receptor n=1 Tax=Candidatus Pelagadaptatus aseana TaxID=3120508 RepID=UPI0039B1A4B0
MAPPNKPKKRLLVQAVALSLASVVVGAQAQTLQLEEIVVTAQKRSESVQDIPVSVSALGSGDLEGLKIRASTEIAAQVPNMQISTPYGDGFPVISMRGISMSDFSLNQSSPVALYVDEVYKGNPALQGVQLYDLERVEVLRGPQGTLYGKNTTGGAVNYITKSATMEDESYLTLGAGDYQRREAQGAYQTVLIDDVLAVRVAGTVVKADGWKENKLAGKDDANAIDEWGGRVAFTYQPADDLEILGRFSSSKSTPVNFGVTAEPGALGVGNSLYELFAASGAAVGGSNGGSSASYFRSHLDDFEIESNRDDKRKIETDSAAFTVNWDMNSELTLTSITSWDKGSFESIEDADGSPLRVLSLSASSEAEQIAQDIRITSDFDGDFNFISGLYYAKETIDIKGDVNLYSDLDLNQDGSLDAFDCLDPLVGPVTPAGMAMDGALTAATGAGLGQFALFGCGVDRELEQTKSSIAAYFDGNLAVNDVTTLRLGLRYTEDKNELDNLQTRLKGNDGSDLGPLIPLTSREFIDREWTGKIGIDYFTDNGTLLYASFSKGYRSGAFNAQGLVDISEVNSVDPEYVDAYEIGFKSDFLDDRVRLNGALFHYAYEGQQFLNVDTATLVQTLVNVDESNISGVELELTAKPTESLLVRAGLGWLDTEVKKGTLSGVDLEGNELIAAPRLNMNVSLDYDIPLDDTGVLTLHLDGSFVDDQYFDVFNTDGIQGRDYWVSNARVSFESLDGAYTLAFWAKNLEDKVYVTQAYDLQAGYGLNNLHIGAPRTMGFEATLRF